MPLLGPDEPLPARPRRVVVAGPSGAGKTTLARRLATPLGLRPVEIDALFHGPGWTERSAFLADVRRLVAAEGWVTEWQYAAARPLLTARADLFVWLDLPRLTVLRQVVRRTVVRRARRQPLWNGNVEPPLRTFLTDPDHIVRWSWRTHNVYAARLARVRVERPDLPVVRLTSRREVDRWLAVWTAAELSDVRTRQELDSGSRRRKARL